jgi:transposase
MPFLPYDTAQAYLLPPSVKDVLGADHLCFQVERIVRALDLRGLEGECGAEGRPAYHPAMMVSLWLYGFLLRVHSTRRLEQKAREDLGFRYLAAGWEPDHKTLSEFLRRHPKTINDLFTQVVELARRMGLGRLGQVAVDSTVVGANVSRFRMDTAASLRRERLRTRRRIRAWQSKTTEQDAQDDGVRLKSERMAKLEEGLQQMPRRLERLRKSGQKQVSRSDPEARWMRDGQGRWSCGYRPQMTVSEDHLIVVQRVTQETTDNHSLAEMVEQVEGNCGQRPQRAVADAGFFCLEQIQRVEQAGTEVYVPDNNLAHELHGGGRARGIGRNAVRHPDHRRLRQKLRTAAGRAIYQRRQALVEPVFGVIKEQLGLRRFGRRGLSGVAVEFALAAMAYNIGRMVRSGAPLG